MQRIRRCLRRGAGGGIEGSGKNALFLRFLRARALAIRGLRQRYSVTSLIIALTESNFSAASSSFGRH